MSFLRLSGSSLPTSIGVAVAVVVVVGGVGVGVRKRGHCHGRRQWHWRPQPLQAAVCSGGGGVTATLQASCKPCKVSCSRRFASRAWRSTLRPPTCYKAGRRRTVHGGFQGRGSPPHATPACTSTERARLGRYIKSRTPDARPPFINTTLTTTTALLKLGTNHNLYRHHQYHQSPVHHQHQKPATASFKSNLMCISTNAASQSLKLKAK